MYREAFDECHWTLIVQKASPKTNMTAHGHVTRDQCFKSVLGSIGGQIVLLVLSMSSGESRFCPKRWSLAST